MSDYDSTKDTLEHKGKVAYFIGLLIKELIDRAMDHDNTKLKEPERTIFNECTQKLATLTYNSKEYKECLEALKPALDHHYARNRHHPEHFPHGVKDMDLVDLIEMVADWKAAALRQTNGNILKTIESNATRFEYTQELSITTNQCS